MMLPIILIALLALLLVPFVYHAARHGKTWGSLLQWLKNWLKKVFDPQQPAGPVVVIQQELHRQIERDQIITLGKSKIAPVGAAVRCHPDDAAKARAILHQIKTEAVNHARTCGLAISESFQVRIDEDPNLQPRRPKVACWIAGQTATEPPTTPKDLTATVPLQAVPSATTDHAGSTWREINATAQNTDKPDPTSPDLPTQLLAQGDIPTSHQPMTGMLRLNDQHGRTLRVKAGAPGQTIGRSESADIRINHRAISRQHALLLREGDGYTIEAHESCTNGVWVDSHPAVAGEPIRLTEGATIVLAPDVIYTATYKATA